MKKYIILLLILSASCQKEVGQIDEDTQKRIREKHVMRYPQLFGTQDICKDLDNG